MTPLPTLRHLLAAGTGGEWHVEPHYWPDRGRCFYVRNRDGAIVVGTLTIHVGRPDMREGEADAALIVALRNAAPALLAVVDAADEAIAELRALAGPALLTDSDRVSTYEACPVCRRVVKACDVDLAYPCNGRNGRRMADRLRSALGKAGA